MIIIGKILHEQGVQGIVRATRKKRVDWDEHLRLARELTRSIEVLPTWTKLGKERRQAIQERAKEERVDPADAATFWSMVKAALGTKVPSYVEGWSKGGRTLETLLRVPKRGNPDHFTRLSEIQEAKSYVRETPGESERASIRSKVYGSDEPQVWKP